METRSLGKSGLQVSVVGLGCMNFGMMNDQAESAAIVNRAIELGINFFDTADVYGNRDARRCSWAKPWGRAVQKS